MGLISQNEWRTAVIDNCSQMSWPENIEGAIGMSVDNDCYYPVHGVIKGMQKLAISLNPRDSDFPFDPTSYMHAFIVNQDHPTDLKITEAIGSGTKLSNLKIGDASEHCGKYIFFCPKDKVLRSNLKLLGHLAAMKNQPYGFIVGVNAPFQDPVFEQKDFSKRMRVIANIAAEILRGKPITDEKKEVASFVCSSFATAIIQASTLITELEKSDRKQMITLIKEGGKNLNESLYKMAMSTQTVKDNLFNNPIMYLNTFNTMPYQLVDALVS